MNKKQRIKDLMIEIESYGELVNTIGLEEISIQQKEINYFKMLRVLEFIDETHPHNDKILVYAKTDRLNTAIAILHTRVRVYLSENKNT